MKHDAQNKQECDHSCFHIPASSGRKSPCHFYAREKEIPGSILFWRISEKPEQVAQDLRTTLEKYPQIMPFMCNLKQAIHCRVSLTLKKALSKEKNNIKREQCYSEFSLPCYIAACLLYACIVFLLSL